jgi:hypothetical protein
MKVSDEMVEAALCAFYITPGAKIGQFHESNIREMRATIEAAIAAWVKPTRAEAQAIRRAEKIANKEPSTKSIAANLRWAKVSPADRRKHMEKAFIIRHAQMRDGQ